MNGPFFKPRVRDPHVIHTHSIVSHGTGRGVVVIEWNRESGQFDPEDARQFAHTLLRECDNAETDAFLFSHFKSAVGLEDAQLAMLITEYRKHRANLERLAGLRKSTDEIPEDDRR
jgi:hypothetical protein